MAYGVKYNLTFKDHFQTQWDVDFLTDGYSGAITDLIGTGDDPIIINYEASDYFTHTPIKASSVEINLIETTDDSYRDFFISDKAYKVKVYKGVNLFWQGWTIAEGYSSLYNLTPKSVKITAVDGLTFLKNQKLNVDEASTAGYIDGTGIYAMWRYFYQAFRAIGLETGVYESLKLYDTRVVQTLSPITEHHLDTWAFYDPQEEKYDNLYDIISSILTSIGARVYQKDGLWYIDHIRQLESGAITYRVYNSSFTYTGTSAETRNYNITSKSGSPLNVPVNHSLYKELERPYSKFVLKSAYGLQTDILRYKDSAHILVNECTVTLDEEKLIIDAVNDPILQGVVFNLGRIEFDAGISGGFNRIPNHFLTINISGELRGWCKVKLFIENEADSLRYYYNKELLYQEKLTRLKIQWDTDTYNDILRSDYSDNFNAERFDESIDIYKSGEDLKGFMYLLINPPFDSDSRNSLPYPLYLMN